MSLMNNLSKIAKSVGDNASSVATNVAKKSSDMIEITKLNLTIQSETDKIKLIQNEIGSIIFSKFTNGEAVHSDVIENCESIVKIQEQISELQLKIAKLKNVYVCEKCGQSVTLNDAFCPKCGEKKIIKEVVVEEVDETVSSTYDTKTEVETTNYSHTNTENESTDCTDAKTEDESTNI